MLLHVRANDSWISMLCDDEVKACEMIMSMHRGGTRITEWHGMPEAQQPSVTDASGGIQIVVHLCGQ